MLGANIQVEGASGVSLSEHRLEELALLGEFDGIRLSERFEVLPFLDDGGDAPDDKCGLLEITVVH